MQLLLHLISKDMMAATPYLEGLGLNLHILIFAVCIAMFATALFSFAPLVRLPMTEMREGLAKAIADLLEHFGVASAGKWSCLNSSLQLC